MGFSYLFFKDIHINKAGMDDVKDAFQRKVADVRDLAHGAAPWLLSWRSGALLCTWFKSTDRKSLNVYLMTFQDNGVAGFPPDLLKWICSP